VCCSVLQCATVSRSVLHIVVCCSVQHSIARKQTNLLFHTDPQKHTRTHSNTHKHNTHTHTQGRHKPTCNVKTDLLYPKKDLYSYKRDQYSYKRDQRSYKRDLYSYKRDLYSYKSDLYSYKSDLYSYQRNLYSCKRDLDSYKIQVKTDLLYQPRTYHMRPYTYEGLTHLNPKPATPKPTLLTGTLKP